MQCKILIIGSEGSMGKRYQAILRYLKSKALDIMYSTYDIKVNKDFPNIDFYTHIILCTPTDTHENYIFKHLLNFKGAIMCEKPMFKNILSFNELENRDIEMMFQYAYLVDPDPTENFNQNNFVFGKTKKTSFYDYFRTGNDGLAWDCLQIIALHNGNVCDLDLSDTSPIWRCNINGKKLYIDEMDFAYIRAIEAWLEGKRFDKDLLKLAHLKVERFLSENIKDQFGKEF